MTHKLLYTLSCKLHISCRVHVDQVRATPQKITNQTEHPNDLRPGQGGIGINGGKMEVHGTRCGFSPAGGSQSRSLAPRRGRAKSAYINIGGSRDTHRTHGITHGTHGKRKHRRRLARTAHDGAQNKRNHRSLSASTHARTHDVHPQGVRNAR